LTEIRDQERLISAPSLEVGMLAERKVPQWKARRSKALDEDEVYVTMESPLGPVFVAYGEQGISAIHAETDPREFEQYFQRHFDRPVRPAGTPPA